jgi:hypothetical protein
MWQREVKQNEQKEEFFITLIAFIVVIFAPKVVLVWAFVVFTLYGILVPFLYPRDGNGKGG